AVALGGISSHSPPHRRRRADAHGGRRVLTSSPESGRALLSRHLLHPLRAGGGAPHHRPLRGGPAVESLRALRRAGVRQSELSALLPDHLAGLGPAGDLRLQAPLRPPLLRPGSRLLPARATRGTPSARLLPRRGPLLLPP